MAFHRFTTVILRYVVLGNFLQIHLDTNKVCDALSEFPKIQYCNFEICGALSEFPHTYRCNDKVSDALRVQR